MWQGYAKDFRKKLYLLRLSLRRWLILSRVKLAKPVEPRAPTESTPGWRKAVLPGLVGAVSALYQVGPAKEVLDLWIKTAMAATGAPLMLAALTFVFAPWASTC
jgi:hypothetical protein